MDLRAIRMCKVFVRRRKADNREPSRTQHAVKGLTNTLVVVNDGNDGGGCRRSVGHSKSTSDNAAA